MAEKKSEYLIYCDLSNFTMLILHCVENNLHNFSCILRKSVMHVTNNQFLESSIMAKKPFKMVDLL